MTEPNEIDDLRRRIADADPARDVAVTPVDSPPMRATLEEIMNSPAADTRREHAGAPTPPTPTTPPAGDGASGRDRAPGDRRRWWLAAAAAAVVAVAATAAIGLTGGSDGAGDEPELVVPTIGIPEPLTLSLGEGQDMMASCIRPSPEVLTPVEVAFAATAVEVDGERVVLEVTRWYTGGDRALVELTAPAGLEALIGGIDFRVGGDYLVSADAGIVNYCGLSGPATPELRAIYDAAFPG